MSDPASPDDGERHGGSEAPPPRPYHWLAALPALAMLIGIPFANRTEPYVLGLPFLLFWILVWVVLTAAVLGLVYALDEANLARSRGATDADTGADAS